ncbi:MAG: diguanylate cyclase [Fuerstiella sp.]|nr:diguanylate cyclase [Fuerstiella sp.]
MNCVSETTVATTPFCRTEPAIPTDSSAVITHLLLLAEQALLENEACSEPPVIPRNVLMMLLRTMKFRCPAIVAHGQRIATIGSGLAELLGWNNAERRVLEIAGLLHDLGKMGVPEYIIGKPGKLSSEEYDLVSQYHQAAVCLLQALKADSSLVTMLTFMQCNFDAAGVEKNDGGVTVELPLGSRILAVADAYDSLCTPKASRRGMPHEKAMKILRDHSGTRYDGNVVSAMERWHELEAGVLFDRTESFERHESPLMSAEQRDEVIVLTQILQMLYQFQILYDGYFITNADGNYCVWSDGMPGLTGRPVETILGRRWQPSDVRLSRTSRTDENEAASCEEIIPKVLRNGTAQFASHVCNVSESQQLSVDVHTMPVSGQQQHVTGAAQLFRCKGGVRRKTHEYAELKLAATRDSLTGVANRGQLETQLRHMIDDYHNHEGGRHLSVVFLDVDRFKSINDTFGHKAGDQVLVDLTRLLQNETYSGEIIARYGGEEFVVVCPDTDLQSAVRRAERLRLAVKKISAGGISGLSVTSSFGVSTARLGDSAQTLLERADMSLFRAKESGRNRTCSEAEEDDPTLAASESGSSEDSNSNVSLIEGDLQYRDTIDVSTSLEITAIKLDAYLKETGMDIRSQDRGTLKLQAGRNRFSRRWGSTPDRQPVEIEVQFETQRQTDPTSGRQKTVHFVSVTMQPVGRRPDTELFQFRCSRLIQEMRAYLLSS